MEKINYQETFSHVVKMITINAVISLAAAEGWTLHQMNVYNAFLQGDLHKEVYMKLSQVFNSESGNIKYVDCISPYMGSGILN